MGTPAKLYLLPVATTTIPTPYGPYGMAVCYLIQMSDGTNVLVDSGHPAGYSPPPGMPPVEGRRDVLTHLADLGLSADEIHMLICTHFDVDHAGYHDAFTKAECVVQRTHYDVARAGDERYGSTRTHWDQRALRYRRVDGDSEILPGVTLIETSGHAPGHQSVLIRLPGTGPVLLAIDAVPMQRLFTPERRAWPMDDDEAQLRASTQKLLDLVAREQVALVVFGHDAEQWQTLRRAPEWYD